MTLLRAAAPAVPVLVCTALLFTSARAEAPAPGATAAVSAPPSGGGEVLVITATRTERRLARVGSAVSLIDASEIERQQDLQVIDALERVPGITVRRDSGRPGARASIFIRGADSDQTLVLLDGVRLQDPSAPNREAFVEHVSVDQIERIEVLRGPQGVLYGSDAIGGVVNIVTRRAEPGVHGAASFEGGRYETLASRAAVSAAGPGYAVSLSASNLHSDGFSASDGDGESDGSDATNAGWSARVGNEELGVDSAFRYIASQIDVDSGAFPRDTDSEAEQLMLRVSPYLSLLGGRWRQKLSYQFTRARRNNDGFFFANFFPPPDFVSFESDFSSQLHHVDWQHTIEAATFLTLVAGLDFEREEAHGMTEGLGGPFFFDAEARRIAGYGDLQFHVAGHTELTAGLRITNHEIFGTEPTFRVTLAHEIEATSTTLRASVGSGFKAPTLVQLFDSTFGSQNEQLDPETALGFDIGFTQRSCDDRFWLAASYFRNEIDDLILVVDIGGFNFVNTNVEEVETQGVELEFGAELPRGIRASGQYTYTRTRAEDPASFGVTRNGDLLRRPRHEFSLALGWSGVTFAGIDDRLSIDWSFRFVGERLDLDAASATVRADDYNVLDLAVALRVLENVTIFGRIENLTDNEYQDVIGFETPDRAATLGIRARF